MTTTHLLVTIIASVLGSGGISGVLVAILSSRKYKAEARLAEQQAESARKDSENRMNEYITAQLKSLAETHKKESEELRRQNKELGEQVTVLTHRLNLLMNWIVIDNNRYITWLESKVKESDPNIVFPPHKSAPVFDDDPHGEIITE